MTMALMESASELSCALELRQLAVLLGSFAYRYANETQLHVGIAGVLDDAAIPYAREVSLDARNRVDFLVRGRIAIEVKVDGPFSKAITQVSRYCSLSAIDGVLLAATPPWAHTTMNLKSSEEAFHRKSVALVALRRKSL